jgi:DNA-directed RNA polymerase subunit H (RpoH/RPB5)
VLLDTEKKTMGKKKFKALKHVLMYTHKKLSKKDKEELLEKYNITEQQLPSIKITDAAVQEFGAELGDVIQITRPSKTAGMTVFYRVVINE